MANRGSVQGRRRYLRCLTFVCNTITVDLTWGSNSNGTLVQKSTSTRKKCSGCEPTRVLAY